jgi:hypothetical protein
VYLLGDRSIVPAVGHRAVAAAEFPLDDRSIAPAVAPAAGA